VRGPLGWSPAAAAAAGGLCAAGGGRGLVRCRRRGGRRVVPVSPCATVRVRVRVRVRVMYAAILLWCKAGVPPSCHPARRHFPFTRMSCARGAACTVAAHFNQSQFLVLFLAPPRLGRRALRHELGKAVPGDREIRREIGCNSRGGLSFVSYASSLVLAAAAAASARLALRACSSSTCHQQSRVKRRRLTVVFGTRCEMVQGARTAIARARVAERSRSAVSIS
jgi:hypothetical protein